MAKPALHARRALAHMLLAGAAILLMSACGQADSSTETGEATATDESAAVSPDTTLVAAVESAETTAGSDGPANATETSEQTATSEQISTSGDVEGDDGRAEEADTREGTSTTDPVDPDPDSPDEPFVYQSFGSDVAPILQSTCAQCHAPGGAGSIHWELATAADVEGTASFVSGLVASGEMPPWPASHLSVRFENELRLSDDERAAIAAWAEAGGEIDVPLDTALPPTNPPTFIEDPDLVLVPHTGGYTGSTAVLDDYRCLIFDPELDAKAWALGYHFEPDQIEVVHHAVVTQAKAHLRSVADALDDADPGPGYTCYGGAGLDARSSTGTTSLSGWAPGTPPTRPPDGYAIPIEPGDFFVVQIHYHFHDAAPTDLSRMVFDLASEEEIAAAGGYKTLERVRYLGPAEIPCYAGDTHPLCDRGAALDRVEDLYGAFARQIPDFMLRQCGARVADFASMTDGMASSRCVLPVENPGRIVSVGAHMHELGLAFRMTKNPGRDDELVLLDIPDWDFQWQFGYRPVDTIELAATDEILIECSWNRERAPYEAVGYVLWAEGTGDEMCFSSITTTGR